MKNSKTFLSIFLLLLFVNIAELTAQRIFYYDGESLPPSSQHDEGSPVFRSSTPSYDGSSVIKFNCWTNTNSELGRPAYDRSEGRIASCRGDMFNEMRYTGMLIYFDENVTGSDPNFSYEMILQMRQCTNGATPPVSLQLLKDGLELDLILAIRNDDDPKEGRYNTASYSQSFDIERGRWYQFTLGTLIKPLGGGSIKFWIDGVLKDEYFGRVGRSDLSQTMEVKTGIYRGGSYPASHGTETVYMDQITYGEDYSSVQPLGPVETFNPDPNKWYSLRSKVDGRYVANSGSKDARILTGNTNLGRHVRFQPAGATNYYNIVSRSDGDYLGNKTENSDAEWWGSTNTTYRRWKVQASGVSGYYNISSEVNGGYLGNKREENDAQVWRAIDTDHRRWQLVEVGAVNARAASTAGKTPFQSTVIDGKSVGDAAFANSVLIYPNPATSTISITIEEGQLTTLQLEDLRGNLVRNEEVHATHKIDVSYLPKGIYIMRLHQENQWLVRKLIVQ